MRPTSPAVLTAVAFGGVLGALARYAVGLAIGSGPGDFVWSTFMVNVVGCALIGAVAVVLVARDDTLALLLRPFLLTGVLGGFTTFSAYALDIRTIATDGSVAIAVLYLVGTLIAGGLAVTVGQWLGRRVVAARGGA